jgi:alkylation response protein AidB-like acyl-CoA dehydrogenase
MDFNSSDLQRMLLDSAERFIGEHYSLEHRRALREVPDGLDREAWSTFAELGWLGLAVPEELGGIGGSMADVALLCAALGTHCVTEPYVSSAVIAPWLLAASAAPHSDLIDGLVAGDVRIALVHDELGERYDYAAPRATILSGSAGGMVLDGQKMLAMDAPSATHYIVTAQGPEGLAMVLVEAASAGITADPYRLYDGSRAADIRFDGCAVPDSAVIATGDRAQTLLNGALDRARIAFAAQAVGSMEAELEICSAYLKERQQFGQPIGKFQALQHIMADMFVATHQARSALYFAISRIESGAADSARAVSLARLNIGEASQLVSRQAIQLHGGYGVTDEYEVSHHYRRQLIIEKLYGDLDYHTRRLAPA